MNESLISAFRRTAKTISALKQSVCFPQFRRFAGYAAPAPRSPGPCDAGRIGREEMAQEATRERAGFPIPVTVSGYTSH